MFRCGLGVLKGLSMATSLFARIRLFPLLILVAVTALGLRVVEISSGIALLSTPTAAEEEPQEARADKSEEEARAKTEPPASAGVTEPLLSLPSNEELQLIGELRERRQQLDAREEKINLREALLAGTETRIQEKIQALKLLEEKIKGHLRIFDEQEAKQLENVVQVYQSMKPKDAAPRFQALDLKVQVDLAMRMSSRKFADILAAMEEGPATVLTAELATRSSPPDVSELLDADGNE